MSSYDQLNNDTASDESSPDEIKTDETSDILTAASTPDSYGSTRPAQDKSDGRLYIPSCALVFYIIAFLGFACSLSLCEALNVAIVAMVNQTTDTQTDTAMTNDTDQCPRDPELDYEGGDFNWNRLQQSVLMSAFYIGRAFTMVYGNLYFTTKW